MSDVLPSYLRYSRGRRWGFLAILFLASMWNYVDRSVMSVLLEPIKAEFHASDARMGLLTGFAFAASYAVFGIPVARLSDRGDRRLVLTVSLVAWSALTACCGLVGSFSQLVVMRLGVGVGESGAIPPAQSLIADYFPPEQRTRALSVFMSSAMFGTFIALTVGAHIAAGHGWRAAFISFGLPGLFIALAAAVVLREPRRMVPETRRPTAESFKVGLMSLAGKQSYVLVTIGMILYFLVAYGSTSWFPAYIGRVLHISLPKIGSTYGPAIALAALIGTIGGGLITDRLARNDPRQLGWMPAVALLVSCPAIEGALAVQSYPLFLLLACVGTALIYGALPGMFAIIHSVCGSPRRALAVALLYFFSNLLGLGFGPLLTGLLSDHFTAQYGPAGLRYALMAGSMFLLPCGMAMWRGGTVAPLDAEA